MTSELLARYDDTMRRNAHPAGLVREATQYTARYTTTTGSLRFILWHQFATAAIDCVIDDELEAVQGRAKSLMWKVYAHDTPSKSLAERLVSRGFKHNDPSTLMMIAIRDVLAALRASAATNIEVRTLETPASLDTYQQIWDDVWPDSPNARYVDDYRGLVERRDPGVVFFAGFREQAPVSSGYMFHHPNDPIALLCGGATVASARGLGGYQAMLLARAHEARLRGAKYLALEASPASEPILKHLGFIALSKLAFYEIDFER